MKEYTIIAPHADDELIGCFELLEARVVSRVLLFEEKGVEEIIPCAEYYNFSVDLLDNVLFPKGGRDTIFLFPDPTYELHPKHRELGMLGEALLREGQAVYFYVTNMLSPYIREVRDSATKRKRLDALYPHKKSLWAYDHKYFLFEGYTQWIININNA